MGETRPSASILPRMWRALKLQRSLYEEVEHDSKATWQGLTVIFIVGLTQAIGRGLDAIISGETFTGTFMEASIGLAETVVGLAVWSYLLYFIGTRLFKGVATPQEVWRTTSFARSPGIFFIIPIIGPIANIWILIAYFVAARAALDLSTGRTLLAVLVSFIPFLLLQGLLIFLIRALI